MKDQNGIMCWVPSRSLHIFLHCHTVACKGTRPLSMVDRHGVS